MQLLELIDYGPNTFGTHKQSGEDSENIDENVRWSRKKSPKTPLLEKKQSKKYVRASIFIQKSFVAKSVKTIGPAPNTYFS